MKKEIIKPVILFTVVLIILQGCMRYLTHDRSEVLLEGVDIDQTLKIAEIKLEKRKLGSVLTIWAIRDQYFTPEQAKEVSRLYFAYIDDIDTKFDVWHLTWAIANMYRFGDEEVKIELNKAYYNAVKRASEVHNLADKMANGEKIYMGDAHGGGRAFAKKHVVVPGNDKYLQSIEDFNTK
jgi:hypothetical protein